jgi:pimeloyl-ACP methyl ester carboxylesterase
MIEAPDGIRLHDVRLGHGADWVIAPGVGNEADFAPLAAGRTVVFFDVRNRGRSDPVPSTGQVGLPVEVDDIDVVRRRHGLDRVDVVGWSYLGLVAALYAARYPAHVRRLVLVCPLPLRAYPPPPPSADVVAQLADLATQRLDPAAYTRAWRRITIPPPIFTRLQVDPSRWPNEHPDHMLVAMQRVIATLPPDYDFTPEIGSVTSPTLVVAGEADTMAPLPAAHEWTTTVPNATLLPLPHVGHYPQVEAPDEFFPAVDAFLRSD